MYRVWIDHYAHSSKTRRAEVLRGSQRGLAWRGIADGTLASLTALARKSPDHRQPDYLQRARRLFTPPAAKDFFSVRCFDLDPEPLVIEVEKRIMRLVG